MIFFYYWWILINGVPMKKTLIQSIILATGQILGKILSLSFLYIFLSKIYPNSYLYTFAYIPFSIFLDLSAFGIIPSVSKIIAKADEDTKIAILKKGTIFCILIGIIFFIAITFFNNLIFYKTLKNVNSLDYSKISYHLFLASFTLFIYPLLSFYRGYFQGQMKMIYVSLSIILENFCRLILTMIIINLKIDNIVKYAFIINFVSYLLSFLFLFIFIYKDYFKKNQRIHFLLLFIKSTVSIGSITLFFTFFQLIDSVTLSNLGVDSNVYTSYMFESIRLIFIPILLAQSIGSCLNPKISASFEQNKKEEISTIAEKTIKISIGILVPIYVIYILFSDFIYSLFYKNIEMAYVLNHVSIYVLLIGFYKIIIGLSMGLKRISYISFATIVGCLQKVVLNFIFVPKLGYIGAILSTSTAIIICLFTALAVLKKEGISITIYSIKHLFISFVIIFIAFIINVPFIFLFSSKYSIIFYIMVSILFYIVVYGLIIVSNKRRKTYFNTGDW